MIFDPNIHHPLRLTLVQRDNLIELARHLITRSLLLRSGRRLVFSAVESERAPLPPARVIDGRRMPAMMPLAHGPLAGIPARTDETWSQYGERAFLMPYGSRLENWIQRPHWRVTDPTPIGTGLRIAYALNHGIPDNGDRISYGADPSHYPYDRLMWEQGGLAGWPEGEGEAEWEIAWQHMQAMTLPRRA